MVLSAPPRSSRLLSAMPLVTTTAAAVVWSLAGVVTFGLRNLCVIGTAQECAGKASAATVLAALYLLWAASHAAVLMAWSRRHQLRILGAALHGGNVAIVVWFCVSNRAFDVAGVAATVAVLCPFAACAWLIATSRAR